MSGRLVGPALLLVGVVIVLTLGPDHGANGWSLLGFGVGLAGIVTAVRAD